jgi:hypothetical protein
MFIKFFQAQYIHERNSRMLRSEEKGFTSSGDLNFYYDERSLFASNTFQLLIRDS